MVHPAGYALDLLRGQRRTGALVVVLAAAAIGARAAAQCVVAKVLPEEIAGKNHRFGISVCASGYTARACFLSSRSIATARLRSSACHRLPKTPIAHLRSNA